MKCIDLKRAIKNRLRAGLV